jgi:glycosyltransferase involved in cell wall biosynthesis
VTAGLEAPEISVVVPTYRRSRNLPRLVAALEAQTVSTSRFEVLIVDNGSDDDTAAVLKGLAARTSLHLRPLRIEDNHGPAPARNLGWQSARGEYVAFTDDDCVPRPDWLEQALASCRATADLGVLQGAALRPAGDHEYSLGTVYRETLGPSPYFEGCNLVFPRAVLARTGGFDETYHFGGEDTAAGWSAIELGGQWLFDETCAVEHDIGQRPFKWHMMMAWREGNLVDVAARHPSLRREGFWRPWAHRPSNVAFAVAAVATLVAVRKPISLLAWLPWLWLRRPATRAPEAFARELGWRFVNDAVVFAGMANASVRNRTVVL